MAVAMPPLPMKMFCGLSRKKSNPACTAKVGLLPSVPLPLTGSYCSPIPDSISNRALLYTHAANTTASAGCIYSLPASST